MNKSHPKKDLLNFIAIYNIPIEEPNDIPKNILGVKIFNYLEDIIDLEWSDEFPEIFKASDLITYLEKPKFNSELNYKDRQDMIHSAKIILNYCRSGFLISNTKFKSYDELYSLAAKVSLQCDIPTCRRAINEFNLDAKLRNKFEIKLSQKCEKELQQKNIKKSELINNIGFKKGIYHLSFE
tara:strand:- start:164 stop:709 length:546 start_codon:yes stop_codon:yes gene_type:complete